MPQLRPSATKHKIIKEINIYWLPLKKKPPQGRWEAPQKIWTLSQVSYLQSGCPTLVRYHFVSLQTKALRSTKRGLYQLHNFIVSTPSLNFFFPDSSNLSTLKKTQVFISWASLFFSGLSSVLLFCIKEQCSKVNIRVSWSYGECRAWKKYHLSLLITAQNHCGFFFPLFS